MTRYVTRTGVYSVAVENVNIVKDSGIFSYMTYSNQSTTLYSDNL